MAEGRKSEKLVAYATGFSVSGSPSWTNIERSAWRLLEKSWQFARITRNYSILELIPRTEKADAVDCLMNGSNRSRGDADWKLSILVMAVTRGLFE